MRDPADMDDPEEFLAEISATDRRIEELREHRDAMLARVRDSEGFYRVAHNLNFLLSEKQIVRHLRFFKIHRERLFTHYERMFGGEPPDPASAPLPPTGR